MTDQEPQADVEHRTYRVSAGKWAKEVYEEAVVVFCEVNEIEIAIREHDHLLTTEVMFDVSGSTTALAALHQFIEGDARMTILSAEGRTI